MNTMIGQPSDSPSEIELIFSCIILFSTIGVFATILGIFNITSLNTNIK